MKLEIVFEDGRKETFDNVASFNVKEDECNVSDVAQPPTEGVLFEVNPLGIDRSRFEVPRRDKSQEKTRKLILEAFAEMDRLPEAYAFTFYTFMPRKIWSEGMDPEHLQSYTRYLGGEMAYRVDQALEWAQRISNGEPWEAVCNNVDTAEWCRVVGWKNGSWRMIGGSRNDRGEIRPPSYVNELYLHGSFSVADVIPLVKIRKK